MIFALTLSKTMKDDSVELVKEPRWNQDGTKMEPRWEHGTYLIIVTILMFEDNFRFQFRAS